MAHLWIDGLVAARDKQPYVQFSNENGIVAQLSMAQARNFAMDVFQMCARTEADAMILKFFEAEQFPEGAAAAVMVEFREFRAALDDEKIETSRIDPDTGEEK